jgi:hypothetical protein
MKDAVSNEGIAWVSHHGPHSTGLPDYWHLAVDDAPSHWGRPYYAEGKCVVCGDRTTISEMKYPNGKHEFMHNCTNCGVRHAS